MMVERSISGPDIADTMAGIGGSRWWFVAYGVLSLVAGVAAVALPGVTLLTLAVLFAAQLFILGIFRIVAAFAVPDTSTGMRVLAIVVGVLSVIVGVLCLRSPLQTIVVLTLVLGAFWLFNGMMEIIAGIAGRGERGRAWSIVGGLIGVVGGIVVLSAPVTSAVTLAWLLSVLLVAHGIVAIITGFTRPAGRMSRTDHVGFGRDAVKPDGFSTRPFDSGAAASQVEPAPVMAAEQPRAGRWARYCSRPPTPADITSTAVLLPPSSAAVTGWRTAGGQRWAARGNVSSHVAGHVADHELGG